MSPYCPGKLLAGCTSPAASELRAEIRSRLAAGETPTDVENALYARFGDEIRAVPTAESWGLLLWVAPFVALIASFAGIAWYVTRRRAIPEPPLEWPAHSDLERRLDDELERN
jgi:cytochrome c-type biogenesis protein CcmH/NrfF